MHGNGYVSHLLTYLRATCMNRRCVQVHEYIGRTGHFLTTFAGKKNSKKKKLILDVSDRHSGLSSIFDSLNKNFSHSEKKNGNLQVRQLFKPEGNV